MVSFRLSGPEYAAAQRTCSQIGVRSVSSLARDATLRAACSERSGPQRPTAEQLVPDRSSVDRPTPVFPDSAILIQLQHQMLCLRAELDKLTARIAVAAN